MDGGRTRRSNPTKREAHRRVVRTMAGAEEALATYLALSEELEGLRSAIVELEGRQAAALSDLAGAVGRQMAAMMAGVDESVVRAALARRSRVKRATEMTKTEAPSEEGGSSF